MILDEEAVKEKQIAEEKKKMSLALNGEDQNESEELGTLWFILVHKKFL